MTATDETAIGDGLRHAAVHRSLSGATSPAARALGDDRSRRGARSSPGRSLPPCCRSSTVVGNIVGERARATRLASAATLSGIRQHGAVEGKAARVGRLVAVALSAAASERGAACAPAGGNQLHLPAHRRHRGPDVVAVDRRRSRPDASVYVGVSSSPLRSSTAMGASFVSGSRKRASRSANASASLADVLRREGQEDDTELFPETAGDGPDDRLRGIGGVQVARVRSRLVRLPVARMLREHAHHAVLVRLHQEAEVVGCLAARGAPAPVRSAGGSTPCRSRPRGRAGAARRRATLRARARRP